MKVERFYEDRDGYCVCWEFTPEQVAEVEQGRPVGWYGEDTILVDQLGYPMIVRSAVS